MFSLTSRYDFASPAAVYLGHRAETVVFRDVPDLSGTRYIVHLVVAGERLDTLAAQYLGSPALWWRIADLNPSLLAPDDLTPGQYLRVPVA